MNTFVTAAWDIRRGDLDNTSNNYAWKRGFDVYLKQLNELLSTGLKFVVFGDLNIKETCDKYSNCVFVYSPLSDFSTKMPYLQTIENIRTSPEWYDQPTAHWLKSSPQAKLQHYIPIQLNKLHCIREASILNPHKSSKFFWVDCGMTREHDINVLKTFESRLDKYSKFLVMTQRYVDNTEIHGFLRTGMNKYCNVSFVDRIVKGPFFGGSVEQLDEIFKLYDDIIYKSLSEKLLGPDETILTICLYQRPDLFDECFMQTPGRNNVLLL